MTKLSIWATKLALCYFVATITLGALALAAKAGFVAGWWFGLRPLHVQFGLIGWFVQLVFGVAYWILPKFSTGEKRPRAWAAGSAVVLINLGIVLSVVGYWWGQGRALGAALELAAAGCFAFHAWPRVKTFAR